MQRLLAIVVLLALVAGCAGGDAAPSSPPSPLLSTTTLPAISPPPAPTSTSSTTSTTAPQSIEIGTCADPALGFEVLCEAVDLILEHHVDEVGMATLARAARRGVAELAEPPSGPPAAACSIPDRAFGPMCQAIDAAGLSAEQGAEAALAGVVAFALDSNSAYLDPASLALMQEEQSGQVEGIGALVTSEALPGAPGGEGACGVISATCRLVVVSTLAGSPAAEAGLEEDDVILSVDGVDVAGLTVDEVTSAVRGPAGTTVTLGLRRDGATLSITITRAAVQIPVVESELVGDVAYVRLNVFTNNADTQLRDRLRGLVDAGARVVVLDLRDNPGGALPAAVGVASEFLSRGLVLRTESPDEGKGYEVEGGGVVADPSIPVWVVVNRGSASASEVVAAVLQETGRGLVVGEPTYGKNTVQQRFPLPNGGALKLTVARWLTPAGTDFGSTGVVPDVAAEIDRDLSPKEVVETVLALPSPAQA